MADRLNDLEFEALDLLEDLLGENAYVALKFDGSQPVVLFDDEKYGDAILYLNDLTCLLSAVDDEDLEDTLVEAIASRSLRFGSELEKNEFVSSLEE